MNINEIMDLDSQVYMNTFGKRLPVCFVKGEGAVLVDESGKSYVDLFGGIAVNILGYRYPSYTQRLLDQIQSGVLHTSNLYYVEPQVRLAKALTDHSFARRVFFANSGTEANEGAVKLARKYFYSKGEGRYKVISLSDSFHGRTLAMVAATAQPKYQAPYKPLPEGFVNVPAGEIKALAAAIDGQTCAVMLELIQGESGVLPFPEDYIKAVRKLCDEKGILMIVDEVQTGMGRTGKLFAYEHYGITPDILTAAKALGGGVPIGVILATEDAASAFSPGDHGSTFGGNALATAAGCAVMDALLKEGLLEQADRRGQRLLDSLKALAGRHRLVEEVRGIGLMIGVQLAPSLPVKELVTLLLEAGFVTGSAGHNTLRLLPPAVIADHQIDAFVTALDILLKKKEA
jgi:acetylornithine/N-succinyldiaminopimelate aminotransferase